MNERIAFYAVPFSGIKSYYELIDITAEYGAKALEGFCRFELETPNVEAAKRIREYADKKGVICPCFSVFADLSVGDPKEKTDLLCRFADVAKILGSPYLHHTIIGECVNPNRVLERKDELFELGINAVRTVSDYANSIGVETVYEDQGFIFNGIEGFARFLKEVERDVGVVADLGNVYQTGDNIFDFISAFGSKVRHAHIKDLKFYSEKPEGGFLPTLDGRFACEVEVGVGDIDVKRAIGLLESIGYNGYYGIEYGAKSCDRSSFDRSLELIGFTPKK